MSRRRRRGRRSTNWSGAIVATVLVAGVAYTVSQPAPAVESAPAQDAAAEATTTRILVGARLPAADRDGLYAVDVNGGEAAPVEVASGWRVEALREPLPLRLVPDENRGVTLADGAEWNVVLRAPTGEAYAEPRLLGMFDERHAAVVARTDRIRVLNVSRAGQVTPVADVPEHANVIGFSGGAVWVSTFTPGEGIESEPSGPSSLYKITADGNMELASGSKESVFVGVLAEHDRLAVWMANGFFTAAVPGASGFSGPGTPLLWMEDRLLVADGAKLSFYEPTTEGYGSRELRTHLAGDPAAAKMTE